MQKKRFVLEVDANLISVRNIDLRKRRYMSDL